MVNMTVAPEAVAGVSRAYPTGAPTVVRLYDPPGEHAMEARYMLRQPFVAEIPLSIRSGVRACQPRVRMRSAAVTRGALPNRKER